MLKFFKLFYILVLFYFIFIISFQKVYALDNFDINFDFFYQFLDFDNVKVTQTTKLTNKETNLYPAEYEMTIIGKLVEEIEGFDSTGKLNLNTTKIDNNKTRIQVKFNDRPVGIGNTLTFSLKYQLSGLTQQIGRVKEINIPRLEENDLIIIDSLRISVPKNYGPVAYVKPIGKFDELDNSYLFSFTPDQIKKGIVVGFADVAHYQFKLTYHLKNDSIVSKETQIAIPPDTAYQQVIFSSIEPKPNNVISDNDGNWLAGYSLKPRESLNVIASGSTLIYASRRENYSENKPVIELLSPETFWEVNNKEIQDLGKKLQTPEKIYQYVINTLKYNYTRVNSDKQRLGAITALKNNDKAICMEFTDVFVAIARAAGIPSREINGYAYTEDEYLKPLSLVADVLHSWPEYWDKDKKIWVPVDPTWESTTHGLDFYHNLDLNHFVFVRHGISSIYPLAPGAYKQNKISKDVEVNPNSDLPDIPETKLTFTVEITKKILAGGKQEIKINIINQGGLAKYNIPIYIKGENITTTFSENNINLPPFGSKNITALISLNQRKFWGNLPLTINVSGEEKKFNLRVEPVELLYFPFIIIGFIMIIILIIHNLSKKHVLKK